MPTEKVQCGKDSMILHREGLHAGEKVGREKRNLSFMAGEEKKDCAKMGKWCYWLKNPTEYEKPIPMTDYEIITRNMSYAILAK